MNSYSKDLALAIALALIWGTTFPIVRLAGNVNDVMFWRYVISIIFLAIIYLRKYGRSLSSPTYGYKHYIYASFSGVFNFLFLYMMYSSLQITPSNIVATIVYTYPLINVLLGFLLGIERRSINGVAGIILGFFGIVLMYGLSYSTLNTLGIVKAVLSSIFFSLSTIFYSLVRSDIYGFTLIQTFSGFLIALMIYHPSPVNDPYIFIAIIHQGLGAGSIAYLIWFTLVRGSIQIASSLVYLVPLIAYISALPILKEVPTVSSIAGLFMVLVGIYIARKKH